MRSKRVCLLNLRNINAVGCDPTWFARTNGGNGSGCWYCDRPRLAQRWSGATVTLTDAATNTSRTGTTNDSGRYAFSNVEPGMDSLTIRQDRLPHHQVQRPASNRRRDENPRYQAGKLESSIETVEVTATNTELQTMNATVGNTITGVAFELASHHRTRRQHLRHASARCISRR